MTYQHILSEPDPGHKPGPAWGKRAACRPRPSAANLRIRSVPAHIDPGSPPPEV